MDEEINPSGLRMQTFPNLQNMLLAFKNARKQNLQKCSRKIMELLVAEYIKNIKEVDEEIKQLYTQNKLVLILSMAQNIRS